jgi:aminoglycoside 6'-N-acetyltransferase I
VTTIRTVRPEDRNEWVRLRHALWPDGTLEEHELDVDRFLKGNHHEPAEVLIAFDGNGRALGFVELSIRNIVDSCHTDRVGYLEGWYVIPEARRQGTGAALVAAAERWALGQGCREFASDAALNNEGSQRAHLALGFTETGRSVNFRKDLQRAIMEADISRW